MGLSGTLEAFPLSEVLRLLARSGQTGRLYAQSGVMEMRAYLRSGTLAVAWAGSDEALGDELVARGLFKDGTWADVSAGELSCEEALNEGVAMPDFDKAVLDITTEGLAKMVDGRTGTFAFEEGNTEGLVLETGLDLDAVLAGVDDRLRTWRRLRSIVPDTSQQLTFQLAVPGQTVEMSHTAWNLLVSVLPSASLDSLIERTGRTSTAVVEEMIELFESGHAAIADYVSPSLLEPEVEESADEPDVVSPPAAANDYLAYVGDDPLGGSGPVGWENDILSIPAVDESADEETPIPLISIDEAPFLVDEGDSPAGFDFGLVGFDVAPSKGRNLLEKDESWDVFSDLLGGHAPKPEPELLLTQPSKTEDAGSSDPDGEEPRAEGSRDLAGDDIPEGTDLGTVLDQLEKVVVEDGAANLAGPDEQGDDYLPDDGPILLAEIEDDPGEDEQSDDDFILSATDGDPEEGEEHAEDELDSLASVLSRLELDEGVSFPDRSAVVDTTNLANVFPYDDSDSETESEPGADQDESAKDRTVDEEVEEEDLQKGLPGLLRRRSRGALARELRSLSD